MPKKIKLTKKQNTLSSNQKLAIYQAKNGAIELRKDAKTDTIWASKKQIASIFSVDRSVVSRHIKNIFQDKELDQKEVCANFAHTTKHGALKEKIQTNIIEFYNLDIILAVGYRTKSSVAVGFRKWATKILKSHITKGFTINPKRISTNHEAFLKAVDDIKLLAQNNHQIKMNDILELIKTFSNTWFSLQSYDENKFPKKGTKKKVHIAAQELYRDLEKLKKELIRKKQATKLFAEEKQAGSLEGIIGNVFQSVFNQDVYETLEEKAAHLLYFVIKNHPFNDGNKRSGAFAFIWFLQTTGFDFQVKITPETLTTLTILIAESKPRDKEKMIGIILLLLN